MTMEIPVREIIDNEVKNVVSNEFRQIVREELTKLKEDLISNIAINNTDHNHIITTLDSIASKFEEENEYIKEETMKDLIEMQKSAEQDAYHTMDELYNHRTILFALVCAKFPDIAWKSKKHSDGTSEDGWFIAGLETPYGQITYHQKITFWNVFQCKELDKAPEYDGHNPNHVLTRLSLLIRDISKE